MRALRSFLGSKRAVALQASRPRPPLAIPVFAALISASIASQAQELANVPAAEGPLLPENSDALVAPSSSAAFSTSIPIEVPSYLGITPSVSLSYSSSGGDDIAGVGWSLAAGGRITVVAKGGGVPWLDGAHDDYALDGEPLYPCVGAAMATVPGCKANQLIGEASYFYSRIDRGLRIRLAGGEWSVWSQDGVKRVYAEKQATPKGYPTAWLLTSVETPLAPGYPVTYSYRSPTSASPVQYLSNISYNGNTIDFYYDYRYDVRNAAQTGGAGRNDLRLRAIDVRSGTSWPNRARAYELTYAYSGATGRSLLKSFRRLPKDAAISALAPGLLPSISPGSASMPPTTFTYQSEAHYGLLSAPPYGAGFASHPPPATGLAGNDLGAFWAGTAWPSDAAWDDPAFAPAHPVTDPDLNVFKKTVAADFDGNGTTDFATITIQGKDINNPIGTGSILFGLGDGHGGWRWSTQAFAPNLGNFEATEGDPGGIVLADALVGDTTGDGVADLMILVSSGGPLTNGFNAAGVNYWSVYTTSFNRAMSAMVGGTSPYPMTTRSYCNNTICSSFTTPPSFFLADVSGDGIADIVYSDGAFVEWHLGAASSYNYLSLPAMRSPSVLPGDLNGDGRIDFALAGFVPSVGNASLFDWRVCPYISTTPSAFADATGFRPGVCQTLATGLNAATIDYGGTSAILADVNGDARKDVVLWYEPRTQTVPSCQYKYSSDPEEAARQHLKVEVCSHYPCSPTDRFLPPRTCTASTTVPSAAARYVIAYAQGQSGFDSAVTVWDTRLGDTNRGPGVSSKRFLAQAIDLDGDGCEDLMSPSGDALLARANPYAVGASSFRWDVQLASTPALGHYFVGDVNGDGILDASAVEDGDISTISLGDTGASPGEWLRADVDGDGDIDRVRVITPAGTGALTVETQIRTTSANGAVSWSANAVPKASVAVPAEVRGATARVVDFNGQGTEGLLFIAPDAMAQTVTFTQLTQSQGTWSVTSWVAVGAPVRINEGQDNWFVGDVTGDGALDVVGLSPKPTSVGYATFDLVTHAITSNPGVAISTVDAAGAPIQGRFAPALGRWSSVDVNNDGAMDLVSVRDAWTVDDAATPVRRVRDVITLLSDRHGSFLSRIWEDREIDEPIPSGAWQAADMNGDGVLDLVAFTTKPNLSASASQLIVRTLESHGNGDFDPRSSTPTNSYGGSYSWTPGQLKLADMDGDGLTDLVSVISQTFGSVRGSTVNVYYSRTDALGKAQLQPAVDLLYLYSNGEPLGLTHAGIPWTVVDDNHDGQSELEYEYVASHQIHMSSVRRTPAWEPASYDVISSTMSPRGGVTQIAYDTALPASAVAPLYPTPTVTLSGGFSRVGGLFARSITTDVNNFGNQARGRVVTRTFDHPVWWSSERSLLGFTSVTTNEAALLPDGTVGAFPNRAAARTMTLFGLGRVSDASNEASYVCGLRPAQVKVEPATGVGLQTIATTEYDPTGADPVVSGAPYLCRVAKSSQTTLGNAAAQTQTTRYSYDDFGQVAVTEKLGDLATGDEKTVYIERAIDPMGYIVAPISQITREGTKDSPGALLQSTRYCFDAPVTSNGATITGCAAAPQGAGRITGVLRCIDAAHCDDSLSTSSWSLETTGYDDGTGVLSPIPTRTTDANGITTRYFYNDSNPVHTYLTLTTRAVGTPLERSTWSAWDYTLGVKTLEADGAGLYLSTSYDVFGRPIKQETWTLGWNGWGNTTRSTTTTQYGDAPSNTWVQTQTTTPYGVDSWAYRAIDGFGRTYYSAQSAVDTSGQDASTWSYIYFGDDSDRPAMATLPAFWSQWAPDIEETEYDYRGSPTRVTHADGSVTEQNYYVQADGAQNYLIHETIEPTEPGATPRITRKAIDVSGNVARTDEVLFDGSVRSTRYVYTRLGDLAQVIDPEGHITTQQTWDALSRKLTEVDPDNGKRTYKYDPGGRLLRFAHVHVDPASKLEALTDALDTTYDALDRVATVNSRVAEPDGSLTTERTLRYVYDEENAANGQFGLNRLTSIYDSDFEGCVDPSWSEPGPTPRAERITYDIMGNVSRDWKCVDDDRAYEMNYGYDDAQRLSFTSFPDGDYITYGYDNASRVTTAMAVNLSTINWASNWWDNLFTPILQQATYNAAGSPAKRVLGNGVTETFSYDPRARLTTIHVSGADGQVIYDSAYQYFKHGQLKRQDVTGAGSSSAREYAYDAQHRLTDVKDGQGLSLEHFEYDNIGRMVSSPGSTFQRPTGPNPALLHAATSWTTPAGSFTATHDSNGQLIEVNSVSVGGGQVFARGYTWDALGRLRSVSSPGAEVSFAYDANGRRVSKTDASGTTYYPFPELEIDPSGDVIKYYYAGGRLMARRANGAVKHYHTDRIGSTVAMTTNTGSLDPNTAYTYAAFGATGTLYASTARGVLFSGARQDAGTGDGGGLIYLDARYYDPALLQFISPDSIAPRSSVVAYNRYAYASQDPINRVDPSGHKDEAAYRVMSDLGAGPDEISSDSAVMPAAGTTQDGNGGEEGGADRPFGSEGADGPASPNGQAGSDSFLASFASFQGGSDALVIQTPGGQGQLVFNGKPAEAHFVQMLQAKLEANSASSDQDASPGPSNSAGSTQGPSGDSSAGGLGSLGSSLENVRIHAQSTNPAIGPASPSFAGAGSYTSSPEVFFGSRLTGAGAGNQTVAHELTHVVHQPYVTPP